MKCSLCRKACRARSTIHAIENGRVGTRLVCSTCAAQGVTILAVGSTHELCSCGELAKVCSKCAERKASRPSDMQKQIAAKLRKLAKAYESVITNGEHSDRAEGLSQAADIVEKWK